MPSFGFEGREALVAAFVFVHSVIKRRQEHINLVHPHTHTHTHTHTPDCKLESSPDNLVDYYYLVNDVNSKLTGYEGNRPYL